ncbi:protein of unknown function [Cupriavidus taiwanensis]|uniref:Uncharacterized protein n=1 Tax=Cupriavidus taiwanensis TaxID=164546 RepID=A0A375IE44_9BURK|nr:protein of unknown function [Cupriavidus taiwanensis]
MRTKSGPPPRHDCRRAGAAWRSGQAVGKRVQNFRLTEGTRLTSCSRILGELSSGLLISYLVPKPDLTWMSVARPLSRYSRTWVPSRSFSWKLGWRGWFSCDLAAGAIGWLLIWFSSCWVSALLSCAPAQPDASTSAAATATPSPGTGRLAGDSGSPATAAAVAARVDRTGRTGEGEVIGCSCAGCGASGTQRRGMRRLDCNPAAPGLADGQVPF